MADLLTTLRKHMASPKGAEGQTTAEIAIVLGMSQDSAREVVRTALAAGDLAPVKLRRVAMDGRLAVVSGYQLVAKKAKR